jgi:hypothetical protein
MAVGLLLTWVVFLLMPEYEDRLADERGPLLQAILIFALMAAASAAAFYAEIRHLAWKRFAQVATLAMVAVAVWAYWPR